MRHTIRHLVVGAVILVGVAACANLDVIDQNEPDRARVLATPGDVESLIAGAFNTWFQGNDGYYGPGLFMSNQAFQHAAPWANDGMEQYGAIPRNAIANAAGSGFPWTDPWHYMYRAIAAVSDGLRSMQNKDIADAIGAEGANDLVRDEAFAYFVLGMAHASLAVLYDQGFVVDETTDLSQTPTPVSYKDMMSAAMGYFAKALQLCQTTFTIPQTWMQAPNMDNTMLAQVIHSEEARYMAANARTPAERQALDWSAIISNIDAGVTSDFDIQEEDWHTNWYNGMLDYGTYPTWAEMPYWIYGMADTSGNYQRWLAQPIASKLPSPPDGDIVIVTPDLRFPRGTTIADQQNNPGSRFIARPTNEAHSMWIHPERGQWRWSWYYNTVGEAYNQTETEPEPEIPMEAMNLLKAEGDFYNGDLAGAATIINQTRVPAGLNATDANGTNTSCVPKVPVGDGTSNLKCGGLFEMLKWEKRMEIQFFGLYGAPWWFDSRGWGDLWKDTPLEFPIPCSEVQILQILSCYGFGGLGGNESAPVSTYDFPGESG